jgi:hypothetical protein
LRASGREVRVLSRSGRPGTVRGDLSTGENLGEAAIRLVELSLSGPAGRVPDVGGPEVLTSTELARAYLEASGRNKRLVGVPLPGKAARAVREGAQLCPDKRYGTVRWEEFLREKIQHQRISGPAGGGI